MIRIFSVRPKISMDGTSKYVTTELGCNRITTCPIDVGKEGIVR